MKGLIGCAWLGLALGSLASPGSGLAQTALPTLVGLEAWSALLGNTITGSTADGPYSDYFAPDGTAIHVDAEGREAGSWMRNDTSICFRYPTDPDEHAECRKVEVQGHHGAFVDPDGVRYPFDILAGNPKNL